MSILAGMELAVMCGPDRRQSPTDSESDADDDDDT